MNSVYLAIKGIALEIVGGIIAVAWIFFGVVTVVVICEVIDKAKGVIRGRP